MVKFIIGLFSALSAVILAELVVLRNCYHAAGYWALVFIELVLVLSLLDQIHHLRPRSRWAGLFRLVGCAAICVVGAVAAHQLTK